jgi:hypothetical protein
MSTQRPPSRPRQPERRGPRNVAGLLAELHGEKFSGAAVVEGSPGGTIHLRDGLVCAVSTPAAPGADVLLLKSRRIAEPEWTAAVAAADNGHGDVGEALRALGMISAAELSVLTTAVLYDGAFALSLHRPDGWRVEPGAPAPGLADASGVEPERLTGTTGRRLSLLTELWGPPGELARTVVRPSSRAGAAIARLLPRHRDILLCADGRRTPRDIAFTVGRGVYPVMIDLARMNAQQLLAQDAPDASAAPVPSLAPRGPGMAPPRNTTPTSKLSATASAAEESLPRRAPGLRRRAPREE